MTDEQFFRNCKRSIEELILAAILRERAACAKTVRDLFGHTTIASVGEKAAKAIEARQ